MANVTKTPMKKAIRRALVNAAISTLEAHGWKVARVKGAGKGRVRRITKGKESRLAVIRTTQDTWIAFPRNDDDSKWVTLSEIDVVVASSVDEPGDPKFAQVHIIEADEMRDRFDRAYSARRAAGHTIPQGRGVWLSLYNEEGTSPVQRVGAGVGLVYPPVARIPINIAEEHGRVPVSVTHIQDVGTPDRNGALMIAEAKVRLAAALGVQPSNVKITIEY